MNFRYILILIFLSTSFIVNSQKNVTIKKATSDQVMEVVNKLLRKKGSPEDKKEDYALAHKLLHVELVAEDARAMFYLGNLYMRGLGVDKNAKTAVDWFKKSADRNHAKAMRNLGIAYKYGDGVQRDLEKSYEWFKKSAELKDPHGCYATGYMYYKGYGTEQNYEKAYDYFCNASDLSSLPGLYFKALCLVKGHGVAKNEKLAKELLFEAAERGSKQAFSLLKRLNQKVISPSKKASVKSEVETKVKVSDVSKEKIDEVLPKHFEKVEANSNSLSIEGEWNGKMRVYDWSGKEISKEYKLQVSFSQEGGKWLMDSTYHFTFTYMNHDSIVYLDECKYKNKHVLNYDIKNIRLEMKEKEHELLLTGNVEFFSNRRIEEGKPAYIAMRRKIESSEEEINPEKIHQEELISKSSVADEEKKQSIDLLMDEYIEEQKVWLKAYPVPFHEKLTIEYSLASQGEVLLQLYDMQNRLVSTLQHERLQSGVYQTSFHKQIATGIYIIRLIHNGKVYTQKVVKI